MNVSLRGNELAPNPALVEVGVSTVGELPWRETGADLATCISLSEPETLGEDKLAAEASVGGGLGDVLFVRPSLATSGSTVVVSSDCL